jgi:hypothetical protein
LGLISKVFEVFENVKESVLNHILRITGVSAHPAGIIVQAVLVTVDKLLKPIGLTGVDGTYQLKVLVPNGGGFGIFRHLPSRLSTDRHCAFRWRRPDGEE